MPHSLEVRIREVARQAWWLMLGRALAWSFIWVALTGCLLGLADYSFRYPGPFPRLIAFGIWLGVIIGTFWRYLLPVLSWRGDPVVIAQRVERQFPQLGDRLSMSIAFLAERASGHATGSAELRSALVEDVSRQVAALRLTTSLDPSGLWRGLGVCLVTVAVVGSLVGLDHESARFALWRLVTPWRPEMWPQMHQLSWLDAPQRLPVGGDFEAVLTDLRGSLPTDVRFESRVEGDLRSQVLPLEIQADSARVRLERVQRSFLFRAVGGDDDTMAWQRVEVVQRPRLKTLRALVTPPAYSGLSGSESTGEIRALAGSTLRVAAHVDQPLRKVELVADFPTPDTMRWSNEDRRLEVPAPESAAAWVLNQSGEFWFAWEDAEGLSSESMERFTVTVLSDAAPTATLEQPPAEAILTPQAVVPIRVMARDDFALQRVKLHHGEESLTLYERSEPPRRTTLEAAPDVQVVTANWELSRHEFEVGQVIEVYAVASDFLLQQGPSRPIRLQIVSPADVQQRVAGMQDELILRLQQARQAQALGWERTQTWLRKLSETVNWGQVEFDTLQGNEQHQRHVRRLLESPDGAAVLATKIVETIRVNRLESQEWGLHIERLLTELATLQQGSLAATERNLHRAVETLREHLNRPAAERQPGAIRTAIEPQLKQAADAQQDTTATLDRWIDALLHWDRLEQFSRETQSLLETQQALITKTQRIDTLGQALDQLTAGERLELEQLADRQAELAERLERLTERMRDAQQTASAADPDLQSNLAQALAKAEQGGAAAASREAARNLRENRVGEAATFQNEALQGLQDLLTAFPQSSPRDTTLRDLIEPLAKQQAVIVQRTESLAAVFQSAAPSPQPTAVAQAHQLATDQERVIEAVGGLENRFGAAQAVVGLALHEAREQMEKVATGLRVPRVDPEVREAGRVALDRLRLLITAIDQGRADIASPDPNSPLPGASSETPQKRVISRTDLEMLKLWQDQLRQRTAELESQRKTLVVSGEVVTRLAEEQRKLALTAARLAAGSASGATPETPREGEKHNTFDDLDAALRAADVPGFSDPLAPNMGSRGANTDGAYQPPTGPPARTTAPAASADREAKPVAPPPTDSPSTPAPQAPASEPEKAIPSQTAAGSSVGGSATTRSSPTGAGSPANSVEPAKPADAPTPSQAGQSRDQSMTTPNPAPVPTTVPGSESIRAVQPTAVEPAAVAGEDVAGEDVGDEPEDPLAIIRREMLAIADRLNGNDTSPATQLAQQRVIDRLSALLADNQASPSVEPNSSAESTSQPAETANQPGTGKDANPRTSGQANESARTTGTTRDVPRGWGKLWGNLPDRIRDQILTPDREQFLPAYEDLIKRYYARLAREDERPR